MNKQYKLLCNHFNDVLGKNKNLAISSIKLLRNTAIRPSDFSSQ
jgi:hypothetical protein